ncbi:MAG: CAP domain-containing protein [Patescibacteria group bacterium]|jgi:uncharacterized protein YkwD
MKGNFPLWKKLFSYVLLLFLIVALSTQSASAQTKSVGSSKKSTKKSVVAAKKTKKKSAKRVLANQVYWRTKIVYRNGKAVKVRYRYVIPASKATVKPVQSKPVVRFETPAPAPVAAAPAAPVDTPAPAVVVPSVPTSVPVSSNNQVDHIISLINAERRTNGLSEVRGNTGLNQAASAKSRHMAEKNYFAHTAPDGTTDWSFLNSVGYKYSNAGANLAMGDFGSDDGLVRAWMNSAGHRANILASFGQEVGIGVHGQYYTMFIAKPM